MQPIKTHLTPPRQATPPALRVHPFRRLLPAGLNGKFALIPAFLLAPLLTLDAQPTWKTLADFECELPAAVNALAKDTAGSLYAAVSTSDADGRMHAQIHKSSDRGATWSVVENFAAGKLGPVHFGSLGADPAGHVYAAGYLSDDQGQYRWIVRKSGVGGTAWSTVDEFVLPGSEKTLAQALTVDANGHVYVAGFGDAPSDAGQPQPRTRWLVRRSQDGGRTWSTLDDFNYQHSAEATAILSTPSGLFVAGSGWNGNTNTGEHWLVRQGVVDGTGTFQWQTVDDFYLRKEEHGRQTGGLASALALDHAGNLYAVGRRYVFASDGRSAHWVVRRASSAGTDWTVVDTFELSEGHFSAASGVASTGRQGVYVVGRAADQTGARWIVRHSATGDVGSWSVSDHFTGTTTTAVLSGANLRRRTPDGSMTLPPAAYATGLAILSDSTGVYTGGSIRMQTSHALVRKLELVNPTKLTATAAQ